MESMVAAISKEITVSGDFLENAPVGTVYLGGGTPSLLPDRDLEDLLRSLRARHTFMEDVEITLEANPDDISAGRLEAWKVAGINRLSIGVQSFRDEDLRWMNRAHHAAQALEAIQSAKRAGFDHDSIDLIFGTPGLSDDDLRKNLETAISLGCTHLSCYALTVEPKTALARDIKAGKMDSPDTEQQARQFLLLIDLLTQAGYEHYEISNFALPGHRSRHNSSYWSGIPYLGLGPSAHSFNGRVRRWNVANNALYLSTMSKGIVPFEEEVLTGVQRLNEYLMTALRTIEGVDLDRIATEWGEQAKDRTADNARVFHQKGWMITNGSNLILTTQGKLFADGMAAELFFDEDALT